MIAMTTKQTDDICLWIDGVGGYAMCDASSFVFGSAMGAADIDAAVFADIPARVFSIATIDETTLLYPTTDGVRVGKVLIERPTVIKTGDVIDVQGKVGLLFRKPNPYSHTAMLTLTTRHRWNHHVDGVVLMSHCCLIGNSSHAHIVNPHSDREWMLTRSDDQWAISPRTAAVTKQSSARVSKEPLVPMKRFKAEGIQLTLSTETRVC